MFKIYKNGLLLLCLFTIAIHFSNAQSPWTRSKGGIYSQLSYQFIPAYDSNFGDSDLEQSLQRTISDVTIQFYGEYGITSKTTLMLSLPYRSLKTGAANLPNPTISEGNLRGLGNSTIALRHNFLSKNIHFSGQIRLDFPDDKYENSTGLRSGYDVFTFLPMLSAGIGFSKAYFYGYGGYGIRGKEYSHFINAGLEGGLHFSKFWLIAFSEAIISNDNGAVVLPANNLLTGLYVNNQEYISIGLKGIYEINRFSGLLVSVAGVADARNLPKSPGLGVGAYFKWL